VATAKIEKLNIATRRVGRPQGSNREQTIDNILRSALRCFTAKGYANTTFKDVAKGAGITHAAIYQYFPSKAALYAGTVDAIYSKLLPSMRRLANEKSSLREQVTALLTAAVELHEAEPNVTAFLSAVPMESARQQELKNYFNTRDSRFIEAIRTMIEQAKASGEIAADVDAETLLMVMVGSLIGMLLYQHADQSVALESALNCFSRLLDGEIFNP
jgi:AcrR family transcriptional regulator